MDEYEKYDNGNLLRSRYEKVANISKGSYGLVSLAKDKKLNDKLVAVKFIYPLDYNTEDKSNEKENGRASSSPARYRSVVNAETERKNSILKTLYEEAAKEISIHKILGVHDNVTSLYDHFDSCLILEYCSRGDLYEAIQSGDGPTTSQDIKDAFLQVLSALDYCHSKNVFHRDLKPENILIGEDWSIKLCDWGLATTTRNITNKNEFDIGSERYMAPELFDESIDHYDASKIDLWSIGIILLTLVFHKNPFQVANYSDKRFVQFASNREALFDIFSTMSGEMFSVTRYCLNIDPSNRDLQNLQNELTALKYFTIDEEYWASDYEDENLEEADIDEDDADDDDDNDDDDEDEYFDDGVDDYYSHEEAKKNVSVSLSPTKSIPLITTTDVESKSINCLKPETDSTTESDTVNSRAIELKDEPAMPHNHRADALLSSSTNMKPIPISDGNIKFIRNTRKPFNVASYNQSAINSHHKPNNNYNSFNNGNVFNNRFNREDFFTPKSVFNHYMDKYGEQRFNNTGKYQHPHHQNKYNNRSDWKRNGNKRRTWKRNYKTSNSTQNKSRNFYHNNNYNNENDSYNHYYSNYSDRRKSHLFYPSKSRKNNTTGDLLANSFHALSHQHNSTSVNSSTSGKYIPPYLRSPQCMKSPDIGPLVEEIDNLDLNHDDEEVFHLDADFEFGNTRNNESRIPSNKSLQAANGDVSFKKPNFKVPTYTIPNVVSDNPVSGHGSFRTNNSTYIHKGTTYRGSGNNTRRNSTIAPNSTRPISMGSNALSDIAPTLSSSYSTSGKYIPPFRRSSHGPIGIGLPQNLQTINGKVKNHYIPNIQDKRKIPGDEKNPNNFLSQVNENRIGSSSVPSDKTDWFLSRKE